MATDIHISEGQILTGAQFSEPMRVENFRPNGHGVWNLGLVGQRSDKFRRVTLNDEEISTLTIFDSDLSYDGDGRLLRLALQAYLLGIAYEYDPYFGLSISKVDPLPHQLEAVYGHLLKLPRVRFLLADDAGAGKTIMAGLLVRELKLRGLIERILVICPANLSFQWQRELKEKFDEQFLVLKGVNIREQFGINQWIENNQVITSLDLAKREDILPGLRQVNWDLVIVDEAHRMSARDRNRRSLRYRLGELLRDTTDHMLMLTATPHKGDPQNFTLFLQLLDQDAYADVQSIKQAMNKRKAPFYLRRTKEAMVYFPERHSEDQWVAKPVFTKRIAHTASFNIVGNEYDLYQKITRYVKQQSSRAAAKEDNPRARAVGFLMSLYQRRLASSIFAMRKSLENRANRLKKGLAEAKKLIANAPVQLPSWEELEEYDDQDREKLEKLLDAVTLSNNEEQVHKEISNLLELAEEARKVEVSGREAKLEHLHRILHDHGFFDDSNQRLLIFTEFKDTLYHLIDKLGEWQFRVGCIHGGMKPGSRSEPGTRLFVEQQFREGEIQILVATEAAGEGINLQCCHILFNYDIPWNPNRLEQRMGRIHRYGQQKDCLIFNFVATNTIEGNVLQRLLDKLQEIRDALDDDAVFNVVGEVLPSTHIERVLRDYYAGKLGDADLEVRLLKNVDEKHFRDICQTALEGLATRSLNLEVLQKRRALAEERRIVPETIARFLEESSRNANFQLKSVSKQPYTFQPSRTPPELKKYERERDWKLAELDIKYPRFTTDRSVAEKHNLEWVTPEHPLFEALRRHAFEAGRDSLATGACFYSLKSDIPSRLDFYRASIVDGLGQVIHKKLFVAELFEDGTKKIGNASVLGDLSPAPPPSDLPSVALLPEENAWLNENALNPFIQEIRAERNKEIERIGDHVEISLTEILQRIDDEIGRAHGEVNNKIPGAEGRYAKAERRHAEVLSRRSRRREELNRQRTVTLQGVERLTSIIVLPHPERDSKEIRRLRPNPETEMIAMREVIEYETNQGREVEDVHKQNLGYDIKSFDPRSGEQRLIEIKGLAGPPGKILLTPNEHRVAEDRPESFWLYIVTNCATTPELQPPVENPSRFPWNKISKVQHFELDVRTLTTQ